MSGRETLKAFEQRAQPYYLELAQHCAPDGKLDGDEWIALNPRRPDFNLGSFRFNTKTGKWGDFSPVAPPGSTGHGIASYWEYTNEIANGVLARQQADAHLKTLNGAGNGATPPGRPARAARSARAPMGGPALELAEWPDPVDPLWNIFTFGKLGPVVGVWFYRTAAGKITAAMVRYQRPGEPKELRPWCYARGAKGARWVMRAPPEPRGLYGLQGLGKGMVVVCEGEKAAEAATKLLGVAGVTSMMGAKAPGKTDWPPLAGLEVVVWPDHDAAGSAYADAVVPLIEAAGAASVRVVPIPKHWPDKWDLADTLPPGVTVDDLKAKLDEAEAPAPHLGGDASHGDLALGFADRYQDLLRYVAPWGEWVVHAPGGWVKDVEMQVWSLAHAHCRNATLGMSATARKAAKSGQTIAMVLKLGGAESLIRASTEQWDADLWLLNTPDGVIDLRTGLLRPRRFDDYMLKCTSVVPAENAGCPKWMAFLDKVVPDKALQAHLQRICGYALTGTTHEHTLFYLYGTGRNGKSTFLDVIRALLGSYAVVAAMDTFLTTRNDRHPAELAMLDGARAAFSQETDEGRAWNEALIKVLTGGDPISARFMRQNFFTFVPKFKLILGGNYKPVLRSVDPAMRARLQLIPFTVFIELAERNPRLKEELIVEEGPGILRWMIEGCLKWQRLGLAPPEIVKKATDEYLESEDVHAQWIEERCVIAGQKENEKDKHPVSADVFTSTHDLFQSWKDFAMTGEYYVGTEKSLVSKMGRFAPDRQRVGKLPFPLRGFKGIVLRGRK